MNDEDMESNWAEYRKLVLSQLEQLLKDVASLRKELADIRVEIAKLQVKSGFYGAMGGLCVIIGAFLLKKFGSS